MPRFLHSLRDLAPAAIFSALSLGIAGLAMAKPPARGEMAVVFAPFTGELAAWALVREAGGLIVSPTQISNVVIAYAPDDGFQDRVRALGALFFVSATGLCVTVPSATSELSS